MQKQIKYNRLTLILPSGKTYTFGPVPTSTSTPTSRSKARSRRSQPQSTHHQLVGTGKFDYPSSTHGTGTRTTTSERSLDGSLVLDRDRPGVGAGAGSGLSTPLTSVGGASPTPGEHKGIYGAAGLDMGEDDVDDDECWVECVVMDRAWVPGLRATMTLFQKCL